MFELNPLNVLNRRRLNTLPPHFSKIEIPLRFDNSIDTWIEHKLKGRFCIVKIPDIDNSGQLKSISYAGFEDQKELTYFTLACPYLRRN
jgi:hypothetical protein